MDRVVAEEVEAAAIAARAACVVSAAAPDAFDTVDVASVIMEDSATAAFDGGCAVAPSAIDVLSVAKVFVPALALAIQAEPTVRLDIPNEGENVLAANGIAVDSAAAAVALLAATVAKTVCVVSVAKVFVPALALAAQAESTVRLDTPNEGENALAANGIAVDSAAAAVARLAATVVKTGCVVSEADALVRIATAATESAVPAGGEATLDAAMAD